MWFIVMIRRNLITPLQSSILFSYVTYDAAYLPSYYEVKYTYKKNLVSCVFKSQFLFFFFLPVSNNVSINIVNVDCHMELKCNINLFSWFIWFNFMSNVVLIIAVLCDSDFWFNFVWLCEVFEIVDLTLILSIKHGELDMK